ncbi:cilia- and flagella-associated protein 157-like [Anoplopoma fimbria]|uniref:cilia- and flagella-associated protein 157-like n=1 Tax=Anoplopoma fimbria TaxID=229290 RepID=UPI0023EDFCD7|nr:cilia- and flagella-associated protein 157-like [Anoplopoma fimbria]
MIVSQEIYIIIMADLISSDDKEKSIYLLQIQYLDKQLERRQLQCDQLEKQNKDLSSGCSVLKTDKTDIATYLKHSFVEKDQKLEELAEQLESQPQAAELEVEALKLQLSGHLKELQDRTDQQNSENIKLVAKFVEQQELEEQLRQLTEQQSDMESVKKQLLRQSEAYGSVISTLKEKREFERKKVLRKMWSTEVDYIETKTSHIIQEERAQHGELQEKVEVLLNKNKVLWKEKSYLQRQKLFLLIEMDKMRENTKELTEKNFSCKMEVEQLTMRRQQVKVELKDCGIAHQSLLVEEESLRQLLTSVSEEGRQKTAESDRLRAELQRETSSRRQLEAAMQEAAAVLSRILTDSQKTSKTQGKMLRLLEILQSSVHEGPGSTPEGSSGGQKPQTTDPQPARTETLNLSTDPSFLMARFRPGDLGLVPRPSWKHQPVFSRTGAQPPPNSKTL